jgi:hypothetical protein
MHKIEKKKLTLSKESLRRLNKNELREIVGGLTGPGCVPAPSDGIRCTFTLTQQ